VRVARIGIALGAASAVAACAIACLGAGLGACSAVQQQRIGVDAPPSDEAVFGPVADMLVHRCGSLDCHGQPGRNLRIWGCDGMRLDPNEAPSCRKGAQGGGPTTVAEHYATYRSLVGLEPNVMSTVYDGCKPAGGAYPPSDSCHPELLTFVRKARGIEAHKGGQLIDVSGVDGGPDPQDVCIVTWLEGATNTQACSDALSIPSFPVPALDASAE
jgi:hypothetical protein